MITYLIKIILYLEQYKSRLNIENTQSQGKRHLKRFLKTKCLVISTFKCTFYKTRQSNHNEVS